MISKSKNQKSIIINEDMMSLLDFRESLGALAHGLSDKELAHQREIMYRFARNLLESYQNTRNHRR